MALTADCVLIKSGQILFSMRVRNLWKSADTLVNPGIFPNSSTYQMAAQLLVTSCPDLSMCSLEGYPKHVACAVKWGDALGIMPDYRLLFPPGNLRVILDNSGVTFSGNSGFCNVTNDRIVISGREGFENVGKLSERSRRCRTLDDERTAPELTFTRG